MIDCNLPEALKERLETDYFVILFRAFEGKATLTAERLMEFDRIIDQPAKERSAIFEKALSHLETKVDKGPDTVIL